MSVLLRIAVIHDHLAGHTRQCEAIVEAIADVGPVGVTRLSVGPWSPLRSHLTRRFALSLPGIEALTSLAVRGDLKEPFDVVVSASGSTISGNVLLKRRSRGANLYSGTVRGIRPGDIDCIIVHQPEHVVSPYHVYAPVPVLRFRPPSDRRPLAQLAGSQIGVILGGEARGAGFDFDEGYCERLFARLRLVDRAVEGIRWVVVTSRRTPASCYPAVEMFCASVDRCEFVDFRSGGSIVRAYGCDGVLVTEDSKTMITEFVRNGYPTIVLRVRRSRAMPVHGFFDDMIAKYKLFVLDPNAIEADCLESALTSVEITQEDIYATTRAAIASRIPGLFP